MAAVLVPHSHVVNLRWGRVHAHDVGGAARRQRREQGQRLGVKEGHVHSTERAQLARCVERGTQSPRDRQRTARRRVHGDARGVDAARVQCPLDVLAMRTMPEGLFQAEGDARLRARSDVLCHRSYPSLRTEATPGRRIASRRAP